MEVLGILLYVFNGLAHSKMAKARGLKNEWMAWVPFASTYQLGQICGVIPTGGGNRIKNPGKLLLGLQIAFEAVAVLFFIFYFGFLSSMMQADLYSDGYITSGPTGSYIFALIFMILSASAMSVLAVIYSVFTYMAYYRIFKLFNPENATMYLVLTIFFGIYTILAFTIRDKFPVEYLPDQPGYGYNPYSAYNPYSPYGNAYGAAYPPPPDYYGYNAYAAPQYGYPQQQQPPPPQQPQQFAPAQPPQPPVYAPPAQQFAPPVYAPPAYLPPQPPQPPAYYGYPAYQPPQYPYGYPPAAAQQPQQQAAPAPEAPQPGSDYTPPPRPGEDENSAP